MSIKCLFYWYRMVRDITNMSYLCQSNSIFHLLVMINSLLLCVSVSMRVPSSISLDKQM